MSSLMKLFIRAYFIKKGMLLLTPISGQPWYCCPRVRPSSPRAKGPRATIPMVDRKWGSAISHSAARYIDLPSFEDTCAFITRKVERLKICTVPVD